MEPTLRRSELEGRSRSRSKDPPQTSSRLHVSLLYIVSYIISISNVRLTLHVLVHAFKSTFEARRWLTTDLVNVRQSCAHTYSYHLTNKKRDEHTTTPESRSEKYGDRVESPSGCFTATAVLRERAEAGERGEGEPAVAGES